MRRIDLDTMTFEFGAWQVPPDQYRQLERIAWISRVLDRARRGVPHRGPYRRGRLRRRQPEFVGSARAEVADILTDAFGVPPENLVTQGYGEEYLKVDTRGRNGSTGA